MTATTTENSKATDEAQIRALLDDRVNAVRARDIHGVMSSTKAEV